MSVYLLDTNFFIQAYRTSYPFDVVPSFWIKVKELGEAGKIISIDKVKNEIFNNEDELKKWCEDNLPKGFFKDSSKIIEEYKTVTAWAVSKADHYNKQARDKFLEAEEADAWLIGFALSDKDNIKIVTHEISNPERKREIKIPDACDAFGLRYLNPIGMFRELGERF